MNEAPRSIKFWLGNGLLAFALLLLLNLDSISRLLGFGAMVLWIALVVAGVWMLMSDKGQPPSNPD